MRTSYYTPATITQEARNFLVQLQEFRAQHTWHLVPEKAALLVIDMQQFFLHPMSHAFVPSALAIVPRIKTLQEYFLRRQGVTNTGGVGRVIQTRHGNTLQDCGQMGTWWRGALLDASDPLAAITPELQCPEIPVICKTQYDAFWQTALAERLRALHATQLVVTGVMAHLCCEMTARAAFTRGFEVFFVIDGTATYDAIFHFATLRNLAHGCAVPVLSDEVVASFACS